MRWNPGYNTRTSADFVPDWRASGVCRTEDHDPDLWFPVGSTPQELAKTEAAKTLCHRCPAMDACTLYAIDQGIPHGMFGGLTEDQLTSLRRSMKRHHLTRPQILARADGLRETGRERTLQTVFDDNTTRLWGGHLAWTGSEQVQADGRQLRARQIAFILDRGRDPEGHVRCGCGVHECVLPRHLTDQRERSVTRVQEKAAG